MKTAMLLVPLLALMCTAHALPVETNAASSLVDVHAVDPAHPRVEKREVEAAADVDALPSEELVRERRSPWGWQPRPQPQPRPQAPRPRPSGSVSGGVHRQRGVGTTVHAQGQGTVWTSRDGRSRVDAQGHYSKVVRGPAKGQKDYNVGVQFEHRF